MEVLKVIQDGCKGMLLDMFGTFVHPLEEELGIKSHHRVGPLQRREQEQGIPRPHRSHQLQPGP
jgi:regulator of PEP synthase PpsR (kinase-PPPase family)